SGPRELGQWRKKVPVISALRRGGFLLYWAREIRGGEAKSLWSRRKIFFTSLWGGAVGSRGKTFGGKTPSVPLWPGPPAQGKRPLMISSANGVNALPKGMDILKAGGDTLDAVVAAVTIVEDDPNDDSVGYGGLPNEEGEVELDASCMHGPTYRAGSGAGVRRIKKVAKLAKKGLERSKHMMHGV